MRKCSLLAGRTQPVQELCLIGHIRDGLCKAAFKIIFENKQDHPVETTFTFPLPDEVCSTYFKVDFNGTKMKSHIARDESARLDFDDTVAQMDFAAMAEVNDKNEIRIDIGAMKPGEKCKNSVYFEVSLHPTRDGFLLVLPTSITGIPNALKLGMSPPPMKLRFDVKDSLPIKNIVVPYSNNTVVDLEKGTVQSDNLSISDPLHILVSFEKPVSGRCLYQIEKDRAFLYTVAPTPRTVRHHNSQFTILLEHTPDLMDGKMSVIMRAIEFFILSVPSESSFNLCMFGMHNTALFEAPRCLDEGNRKQALSMIKDFVKNSTGSISFSNLLPSVLDNITSTDESIVIVIASSLPEDQTFDPRHKFFLLEPASIGNLKDFASQNVTYMPVTCENMLISVLLDVIKFTSGEKLDDINLVVDGKVFHIPPTLPGMMISSLLSVPTKEVKEVSLKCRNLDVRIPVAETALPCIHHLWAFSKIKATGQTEAGERALAARILTPNTSSVVAIERDDEVDGDVTHIDSRLSRMGVGWVEDPETKPQGATNNPATDAFVLVEEMTPRETVTRDVSQDKRVFYSISDSTPASVPVNLPPLAFKGGKKPFFLLRLLQLQNPDGSWNNERSLAICCGFPIPTESLGLARTSFITAFVIACLRVKAAADEDKWELIAEKGIMYLMSVNSGINWNGVISEIEQALIQ